MMSVFLKKLLIFILPLFALIVPPVAILSITGENFKYIDNVVLEDSKYLIGYAYNENNYKYLKYYKLLTSPTFDVITIGSSRVLKFRENMFTNSFYNAGFTIESMSEFKLFLEGLPKQKYPKVLILGLDQWMFNVEYYESNALNVDKDKWKNSFTFFPKMQVFKNVYTDLIYAKYSFITKNEMQDNFDVVIGLNAHINNKGFLNDGSNTAGNQITDLLNNDSIAFDFGFNNTLSKINRGISPFYFGSDLHEASFKALDELLFFCKTHNIAVISFLPPFPKTVYSTLKSNKKFNYIHKIYPALRPMFKNYNFELYDMTFIDSICFNDEFLDGYHGSEVTYQRMLIYWIEQNSVIRNFTDLDQLHSDLEKRKNSYLVFIN